MPPSALPLLESHALEKIFPPRFHLHPFSTSFYPGETVAILGKNGAGKSTLFQLLTANLEATHGSVSVQGKRFTPEAVDLKRQFGYLPQDMPLPKWVSGREILTYAHKLYGVGRDLPALETIMAFWDCSEFAHVPLASCSYGMQKRIALALATMHDPLCLILDEPFSGLDIFHIRALEETIAVRSQHGQLTILSTHVIPYVARLCDRVFIITQGQVREIEGWRGLDAMAKISFVEKQFFL